MHQTLPYRRVLALINFDSSDEDIARKALLLARLNRAQLVILHLIEPDAALDGGYPAASAKADAASLEAAALRRLSFLSAQIGAGEAECMACFGPRRQTFRQVMQSVQADLVVAAMDPGLPTGSSDVLILGHDKKRAGGRLVSRLLGWLGGSFQPAALQ
jgi:hypothetical protein